MIGRCWVAIGEPLQALKVYVKTNASRRRAIVDLPPQAKRYVITETTQLFNELTSICIGTSQISKVGASKVLFAILPEIALPVDNLEWEYVFQTSKYEEVLSTMANEIQEWETKTRTPLQAAAPHTPMTLPAIYNILAMAARDLSKANW